MPLPADEEALGGIVINPNSPYGKELAKWEQHHTYLVGRGMQPGNPYVYRPFPKMVYRACEGPGGKTVCFEQPPEAWRYADAGEYERARSTIEMLNQRNQRTVHDETEYQRAKDEGWRNSPKEALEHYEAVQRMIGDAAAEENFRVKKMSPDAQAEWEAAQTQTHRHVTDLAPVKKRGRGRPKARAVEAPEVAE